MFQTCEDGCCKYSNERIYFNRFHFVWLNKKSSILYSKNKFAGLDPVHFIEISEQVQSNSIRECLFWNAPKPSRKWKPNIIFNTKSYVKGETQRHTIHTNSPGKVAFRSDFPFPSLRFKRTPVTATVATHSVLCELPVVVRPLFREEQYSSKGKTNHIFHVSLHLKQQQKMVQKRAVKGLNLCSVAAAATAATTINQDKILIKSCIWCVAISFSFAGSLQANGLVKSAAASLSVQQ